MASLPQVEFHAGSNTGHPHAGNVQPPRFPILYAKIPDKKHGANESKLMLEE
jgi:hypothetical protein